MPQGPPQGKLDQATVAKRIRSRSRLSSEGRLFLTRGCGTCFAGGSNVWHWLSDGAGGRACGSGHPLLSSGFRCLILGSWRAMLPVAPIMMLIVRRAAPEDRFLHKQLEGYVAYSQRVRYRLVPGVW